MQGRLKEVVPGVLRGYSHSESSVRKASVFCLVAVYSVVGEKLREHLNKLSSSQVRVKVHHHDNIPILFWLDLLLSLYTIMQ